MSMKTNKKKQEEKDRTDIMLRTLLIAALSVFLFFSNLGFCGAVGNVLSDFLFGLFGWIQYILPAVLLISMILEMIGGRRVHRKIIWFWIALAVVAMTIQFAENTEFIGFEEFYGICEKTRTGGGVLFGGLLKCIYSVIGVGGTIIFLAVLYIICFGEVTGLSLIHFFAGMLKVFRMGEKKAEYENVELNRDEDIDEDEGFSVMEEDTPDVESDEIQPRVREARPQRKVVKEVREVAEEQGIATEQDVSSTKSKMTTPRGRKRGTHPLRNRSDYNAPPLSLLHDYPKDHAVDVKALEGNARKIESTLANFGIPAEVVNWHHGSTVTQYELEVDPRVNLSRISSLTNNLMSCLAARSVRIIAPIPGKSTVGIEVENQERETVYLRKLLESEAFQTSDAKLGVTIGEDIEGNTVVGDIADMPHMLIAGTTGSGKSVFLNSILTSILYRNSPSEVRLVIIDPKSVEFSAYYDIPHMLLPVVTDKRKAGPTLEWVVNLMEERYAMFSKCGVDSIKAYNEAVRDGELPEQEDQVLTEIPRILVVLDEFADLNMDSRGDVRDAVMRIGQKARAAGIHLILATQRPSSKIIDGDIKANIPGVVALKASNATNSRVIMETNGAEKLLGNGDMFFDDSVSGPVRAQGALISKKETNAVMDYIRKNNPPVVYEEEAEQEIEKMTVSPGAAQNGDEKDVLYDEAVGFAISKGKVSISSLQRVYRIGFNRAARIVDRMYEEGIIGPDTGTKAREVLITEEEWEQR